MKTYQWVLVLFVSMVHFSAFTQRMNVVPFLVDLRDVYGVGYAEVGGLASAFLLGYALFQIPAGVLADRYSPKKLIFIGVSTMFAASLLFAVLHTFWLALLLRFVMGLSSAMLFSPGIKLISAYTPRAKRGLSIGIMEGGAGLGMLMTLTLLPLLSLYVNFQTLFIALSFVLLLLLVMFLFLPKSGEGKRNEQKIGSMAGTKRIRLIDLIKKPVVIRLIGISFFGLFGLHGFLTWLPTYLEAVGGFSKQQAAWVMAVAMVSQIIMGPVSGKVSDWMEERKSTLVAGSVMLAASAVWLLVFGDSGIFFTAILIGTGISWAMAPMLTIASELIKESEGAVISIINTVGQSASAISGYVFGLFFELSGHFQWIWFSCLLLFAIRIVLSLGNLEDEPENPLAKTGHL
ncbi:MFS transporter [Planomicrobium sp. CPCC 101110]|uniref:MFS transporter n=1 Tax=Planomicrobium sp. CPCC 101110 TaxID=2599619 RepID=UPI0011B50856|nr:MFS transporter [Planomicrobium sp. CPCC 101110]TWT25358.1 MFS transporter [Planomicrobium sp. CPCC 101110]